MELFSINSTYSLCEDLYGVTPNENSFEDLAMEAWGRIGTKHTRLYRFVGSVEDGVLKLPCNLDEIESVHIPVPDAQVTNSLSDNYWTDNVWIEQYIDSRKRLEDPYWTPGKLIKYDEGNGELYFSRNYPKVMVVYHGYFADEDGLPLINEKEQRAIATFLAYTTVYKDSLKRVNIDKYNFKYNIQMTQDLKREWLRLCNAARVKERLSQNDMDRILDAKTSWNRKQYGKSYKGF